MFFIPECRILSLSTMMKIDSESMLSVVSSSLESIFGPFCFELSAKIKSDHIFSKHLKEKYTTDI